jgi:iron complex outermembrane receptor protein
MPTALHAQELASGAGDQHEIIITATGRSTATSASKAETPIIEAAQTISIVTREEMDVRAVGTVGDALAYTAGVNVESSGIDSRTDEIVVRGFGAGGFSSNSNFVDGLRLPNGGQWTRTQFDPFGIEQVEVLKGPSSVLYGQTAPGGIINTVTKRASANGGGELMLQSAGFTDLGRWQFQAAGDVGGALNGAGTLSARIVGLVRDGQTQIRETSNSRYYVSPSITWTPNDDVSWTLLGQYQRDEGGSTYQFLPMTGTLMPSNGRRIALDKYLGEPDWNTYDRDQVLIASFFRAQLNENISFRNSVRYTRLTSLYRVTVLSGDTLNAPTPGAATCAARQAQYPLAFAGCIPGQTIARRAVQGEGESDGIAIDTNVQARFATGPIEHTLLAGIDYFYTDWEHYRDLVILPGLPRGEVDPLLDVYNPTPRSSANYAANLTPQIYTEVESNQLGLYAQNQMKIGDLRITIGGRQDWARDDQTNAVNGARFTAESDDFTWQAGAVWLLDSGFAPYASYAQSFQPQVSDPASNADGVQFVPTTGEQIEAGLRFAPRGTHAYITLGAYQITQQNVVTPDPLGRICGVSICSVQTGEVRLRGIELEGRASTRFGLTAVGSLSRTWSKVTESNTPSELGNRVTQTPEWLASVFVDYRLPEGALHGLGVGGGVRYTGRSWGNLANTIEIPDHALFDLFVRYDFGRSTPSLDGLSLSINARNLADKTYVATCGSSASCFYGSGRAVTARLQYRW